MSYSIAVRGKTKHEATLRAQAALASQLTGQPTHARDAQAAMASVAAHVGALDEPAAGMEVVVEANGSTSGGSGDYPLTSAAHTVRAYVVAETLPA